ncbi:olfactory receptor 5B12-like, partial [Dromaius novaehollandiae]|uniref:olfactory receptor 5B12-like n=1 Tax=Dromaius novaehollandiae TaxID=8790 RepID=UPI00312019D1
LHYSTLMGSRACVKMAAAAWGTGFLHALLHTANTFSIPLCQGNTVDQFFCEIPQILKLSCSDSYLRELGVLVVSLCLVFGCFIFIVVSYVQIFTAVLRIPSEQGRHKAFSMCLPHLAVVSLFVSTAMFAYLKPPSLSSPALDLVVAVLYSVVPPGDRVEMLHDLERILPGDESRLQKTVVYGVITAYSRAMRVAQAVTVHLQENLAPSSLCAPSGCSSHGQVGCQCSPGAPEDGGRVPGCVPVAVNTFANMVTLCETSCKRMRSLVPQSLTGQEQLYAFMAACQQMARGFDEDREVPTSSERDSQAPSNFL